MSKRMGVMLKLLFCVVAGVGISSVSAQTAPTDLPRLNITDFQYAGAFRLPADEFGSSSVNYSQGPIAVNASNNSIFIVGHAHHQSIAQFTMPALSSGSHVPGLAMASTPLQPFSESPLSRAAGGNSQNIDRIGGLLVLGGTKLVVNGYEYYDADGGVTDTTLIVDNSSSLSSSTVTGFHTFSGGAGHTSGWMSPISGEWQSALGGSYITGQSSGIPIISRTSVGPSAFSFDHTALTGSSVPNPIATTRLMDFSLDNPLHEDLSNDSGTNDLWTHLSRAVYGFVAPGTRTYVTVGHSGGHRSGVCYKCTPQGDDSDCGGYCAKKNDDNYLYYWLWDIRDLVAVKSGSLQSHAVRPYSYGILTTPFSTVEMGGGSFDPVNGLLYLTLLYADREQGAYSTPPLVIAYRFNSDPGSGDGGNGGGGPGSSRTAGVGKAGKWNLVCVEVVGQDNAVRYDRGTQAGQSYTIARTITLVSKNLTKAKRALRTRSSAATRKKYRTLKATMKRLKMCRSNQLPFA